MSPNPPRITDCAGRCVFGRLGPDPIRYAGDDVDDPSTDVDRLAAELAALPKRSLVEIARYLVARPTCGDCDGGIETTWGREIEAARTARVFVPLGRWDVDDLEVWL